MVPTSPTASPEPLRQTLDAMAGATLLEFGTTWCGHCQVARPLIESAIERYPGVRHLRIEDGRGQPLGRSYRVKLWPTLVFLRDGVERTRLVRPTDQHTIDEAFARLDGPAEPAGAAPAP